MKIKKPFTPAPWSFNESGTSVMGGTSVKKAMYEHKNTVCHLTKLDMVTGNLSEKEYKANGKLIERAPDMFDFIESVYDQLDEQSKERAKELLTL